MLRRRVIPCLDVANGRVVKGTRFVDLVDEGDPAELAERYAAEGADEICLLDITAAPQARATLLDVVERTARRAFIPLTVGGGVRSVDEMRDVLRAGADKVSLNTAAVADPDLVRRCAARFGRQAVVVAIDARQQWPEAGDRARDRARYVASDVARDVASDVARDVAAYSPQGWDVIVRGGREATGLEAVAWAERAVTLGAGELLVTSIDRDGTQSGFDTALLRAISDRVPVPVIASGGASGPADFVAAVIEGGADAVLAASIFHRRIHSIGAVKAAMAAAGLPVRLVEPAVA
jgi:imidazole glycerol-phosphate synthase subunit HisF